MTVEMLSLESWHHKSTGTGKKMKVEISDWCIFGWRQKQDDIKHRRDRDVEHQQNTKEVKTSNQVGNDQLSNLPQLIIHHILSLMDTKFSVRTCVLSKKWMSHGTQIHIVSSSIMRYLSLMSPSSASPPLCTDSGLVAEAIQTHLRQTEFQAMPNYRMLRNLK